MLRDWKNVNLSGIHKTILKWSWISNILSHVDWTEWKISCWIHIFVSNLDLKAEDVIITGDTRSKKLDVTHYSGEYSLDKDKESFASNLDVILEIYLFQLFRVGWLGSGPVQERGPLMEFLCAQIPIYKFIGHIQRADSM